MSAFQITSVNHFWKLDTNKDGRVDEKESEKAVAVYDTDDEGKTVELWEYMQKVNEQRKGEVLFGAKEIKAWKTAYKNLDNINKELRKQGVNLPLLELLDLLKVVAQAAGKFGGDNIDNIHDDVYDAYKYLPKAGGKLKSAGFNPNQIVDLLKSVAWAVEEGTGGVYDTLSKLDKAGFSKNQIRELLKLITQIGGGRFIVFILYDALPDLIKAGVSKGQILNIFRAILMTIKKEKLAFDSPDYLCRCEDKTETVVLIGNLIRAWKLAYASLNEADNLFQKKGINIPSAILLKLLYSINYNSSSPGSMPLKDTLKSLPAVIIALRDKGGLTSSQACNLIYSTIQWAGVVYNDDNGNKIGFYPDPNIIRLFKRAGYNFNQIRDLLEAFTCTGDSFSAPFQVRRLIGVLPKTIEELKSMGFNFDQILVLLQATPLSVFEALLQTVKKLNSLSFDFNQTTLILKSAKRDITSACTTISGLINAGFSKEQVCNLINAVGKIERDNYESVYTTLLNIAVRLATAGYDINRIYDFLMSNNISITSKELELSLSVFTQGILENQQLLIQICALLKLLKISDVINRDVSDSLFEGMLKIGLSDEQIAILLKSAIKIGGWEAQVAKAYQSWASLIKEGLSKKQIQCLFEQFYETNLMIGGVDETVLDVFYLTVTVLVQNGYNTNKIFDITIFMMRKLDNLQRDVFRDKLIYRVKLALQTIKPGMSSVQIIEQILASLRRHKTSTSSFGCSFMPGALPQR